MEDWRIGRIGRIQQNGGLMDSRIGRWEDCWDGRDWENWDDWENREDWEKFMGSGGLGGSEGLGGLGRFIGLGELEEVGGSGVLVLNDF